MGRKRVDRREFLKASALVMGTAAVPGRAPRMLVARPGPVVISSANGFPKGTALAMEWIQAGKPAVDAVVAGVNLVEDDPRDQSVGYGGHPNADGVVELDSSVMDGRSGLSGAVAALRNIRFPSRVALKVMRYTDHCLLVGEGALRFARAHGFQEEDLLTEESRAAWLRWKSRLSDEDDWLDQPGDAQIGPAPKEKQQGEDGEREHGTINMDALDANGDLAGVTTTSGLAYKIPGRVGDSPIIGAGLFVDNDVGAAGSTGRGEANIVSCGSATVVEGLRQGMAPVDACLYACRRIAAVTHSRRLLRPDGRPAFQVSFYAVDKQGRHGGAAIWPGGSYAVFDAEGNRLLPLAALYEK